ncbi:MAG: CHC2 zinc finger domain-containing protein [Arachidicoccus sp.]|nr:CHC2 zinc finger domain-containing protein [Arachidicoccus sp.]
MTIQEAKALDMVAYLSGRGYEPTQVKGVNYWYLSPLRKEKTPSFKVNRLRNQWYDFGIGKGGDLLDFIRLLDNCTIPEVLQKLEECNVTFIRPVQLMDLPVDTPSIEILSVHIISSSALIRYCRSRCIPWRVADHYLQEVRYNNGGKIYYALGFKNDAGGYELRSSHFKGSSSPKSSTWIKNGADILAVFEGFFYFLSYLVLLDAETASLHDFLILNSVSFFSVHLTEMQSYKRVHLYLDNDNAGNRYTALALEKSPEIFVDERGFYKGGKDLNEWLVCKNSSLPPAA